MTQLFFPIAALLLTLSLPARPEPPVVQPSAPKFIIGVWYQPASSFQKWKDRGINTLIGYESEGNSVTRDAWMKSARPAGLFYVAKPIADDPNQMKADLADPNLLAWEQPDEPDGGGNVPPEQIIKNYQDWKKFGDKPVLLNFDGWKTQWRPPADYIQYCQGGDWIGFDYYIINRGEGPQNINRLGERLDKLKQWSGGAATKKKFFVFIECSDQNLKVQDWAQNNDATGSPPAGRMRCPTPDEMRKEVDVSIAHGASGIVYFPDMIGKGWEGFDGTTPELESAMKQINAKLTGAAAKLSPDKAPRPVGPAATRPGAKSDDPYDGTEITIDGKTYILKRKP